jgi:hypothetical protein
MCQLVSYREANVPTSGDLCKQKYRFGVSWKQKLPTISALCKQNYRFGGECDLTPGVARIDQPCYSGGNVMAPGRLVATPF